MQLAREQEARLEFLRKRLRVIADGGEPAELDDRQCPSPLPPVCSHNAVSVVPDHTRLGLLLLWTGQYHMSCTCLSIAIGTWQKASVIQESSAAPLVVDIDQGGSYGQHRPKQHGGSVRAGCLLELISPLLDALEEELDRNAEE